MTISSPPGVGARLKFWKILVIEDDVRWRMVIELYLQAEGHTVLTAADGVAGLERAMEKPDLILCDVVMPGMTGYAVLEALRRRVELRDIPFVFLTGQNARADLRKGMVLGADDYLTKPFQREELIDCVTTVMTKRMTLLERLGRYTEEYQREIVAPWAHELLTPLNGILGISALLEAEPENVSPADLRELAAAIRVSARRQQALARKIMNYFKLEQLRSAGWSDPLALVEAGSCVQEEALGLAEQAGRSADLQLSTQSLLVRVNVHWLRAAVGELVENAFKFSSPGQPVVVRAHVAGRHCQIEVIDQGMGMSEAERAAIGAFRQFDRVRQEQQGLGLGLAVALRVAQLHGGSLTFATPESGVGLSACLNFPLAQQGG